MSAASPEVDALLARTTLVVRPGRWALGAWRHAEAPAVHAAVHAVTRRAPRSLAAVLHDELELTALLPEDALAELPPPQQLERDFAALTLDTVMAWDVLGVLARVTTLLAEARVPLGAVTAYSRDHLLVPAARLDAALAALEPHFAAVRRAG